MHIYFYFLCHHGEYSCGFLHITNIIHMGLRNFDAAKQIFLFYFPMQVLMQKIK
jgi:hypothetical protein